MLPVERLARWLVASVRELRLTLLEPSTDRRPEGILHCVICSKEIRPGEGWYDGRHREAVCDDQVCAFQQQADAMF